MGDEARPFPKSSQLARGERRRARKVASRKEWAGLTAAKIGPCRVCCDPGRNGSQWGKIQLHHLVPRARGGDDVAENLVPLCLACHERVTARGRIFMGGVYLPVLDVLAEALTEAERAYVIGKRGSLTL